MWLCFMVVVFTVVVFTVAVAVAVVVVFMVAIFTVVVAAVVAVAIVLLLFVVFVALVVILSNVGSMLHLNLTSWWNPAAEWQSADRCHRIGQARPCIITKLCIEDSIESRVVLLQKRKEALIRHTVDGDVGESTLREADLSLLFRGR